MKRPRKTEENAKENRREGQGKPKERPRKTEGKTKNEIEKIEKNDKNIWTEFPANNPPNQIGGIEMPNDIEMPLSVGRLLKG